jgi:hypothetical protein
MKTVKKNPSLSFKTIPEFLIPEKIKSKGEKLESIRSASESFRKSFKKLGFASAVKTVDLISAAYPTKFAYANAAYNLNPYVNINNRLVVIQFMDFENTLKTLVWEPTVREGSARAPFYKQLLDFYGEFLSYKIMTTQYNTLTEALEKTGVKPEQVDYVSFDHLHVQDLRFLMGTTKPILGESEAKKPFFPNAKFLFQRKEIETLRNPHPLHWAWYVTDSFDGLDQKRLVLLDGDTLLGKGVAFLSTPGHTDGNQSLCVNTPSGIWLSSENGVSIDSYFPEHSTIPGLKQYAKFFNREVILNSNTLEDSIEQYDSMVKEKSIADVNQEDERFKNIIPSSEVGNFYRQFPVLPVKQMKGMNFGNFSLVQ